MDQLNVNLTLVDLKQIFLSLWLEINDPKGHLRDDQKEEYTNNLIELANRLEKVMSDNGLEIRKQRKFNILCNMGGW